MPTTTPQTVNCACCSGPPTGGCTLCSNLTSGTDGQAGMPTVLNVTVYGNYWNRVPIAFLLPPDTYVLTEKGTVIVRGSTPYCDCLASGVLLYNSDDYDGPSTWPPSAGQTPPAYYDSSPRIGVLAGMTFPLTYDPNYVVRLPDTVTGAWVYRQYNYASIGGSGGGTWYAFIIRFYCTGSLAKLSISWHSSSAGFESSGTGTGTADMNGDPITYDGLIYATATLGIHNASDGTGPYENTCDPPYFVFGQCKQFGLVGGGGGPAISSVPTGGEGVFQGLSPDQTSTGNILHHYTSPLPLGYDLPGVEDYPDTGYRCDFQELTAVVSL